MFSEDHVVGGNEFFGRMLVEGCLVNPAGVMIRATALRRAGRFSEEVRWGIDWHMWLRLCLQGDVAYIASPSRATVTILRAARPPCWPRGG